MPLLGKEPPDTARPRLGLRAWAILLVVASVVPLLIFGAATLHWITQSQAIAFTQSQTDTVRALALAVDGEVHAWKAVVTTLAESRSLRPDRLAEFYEEARQVAAPHDGWVVLTVASGEQLLNTLRPYDTPLAKTSSPETIAAVFRDGQPVISDIFYGQNAQRYMVSVAVPVVRDGKVVNCLTLNFAPQRLSQILQWQQLPASWTAAINDRQGQVVARSRLIEERIGKPTVPWLVTAIQAAKQGVATGLLNDGRLGQVAFQRLHEVPWTVTLSIPVAEFPSDRPVKWFTLLGLLVGLGALGATLYASRKLTRPVTELAARAEKILKGEAPERHAHSGIREIHALEQALVTAASSAEALHQEQARAAVAEARAKAEAEAAEALRCEIVQRKQAEAALRESEAKFATAFETSPIGISLTTLAEGRYLDVNEAYLDKVGFSRDELLGHTSIELGVWPDADARRRTYADLQATGTIPERELTFRRKSGETFPCLFSCELVEINGQPVALANVVDITERKQSETALRDAHATLEQRVQERTAELSQAVQTLAWQSGQIRRLASDLTMAEQRERSHLAELIHDGLQQLLVAAKFRLELLARGVDPAIRQGCDEVVRLLDAALVDARSLTSQLSPPILRSGGLLAGLTWLVRWSRETHRLTVHLQAPMRDMPKLPEDLTVILFQSVRELLFNIVKYAQVAEATVTLAQTTTGLTVTVADAGVGFDPTHLRAEGSVTGGFGLARTRQRLELLGGCMDIESAPGHGTRVTLAVPLPQADQPAPTPGQSEEGASVPGAVAPSDHRRKIRVLLADDHQVMRQALSQMLRTEPDVEVVGEAGTGTATVALVRQLTPDVVLMDINIPELNGIEATRAIRTEYPAVQVIGLSMYDSADQQAAMQQAGAVGYVSKSAPAEELLAVIRASVPSEAGSC